MMLKTLVMMMKTSEMVLKNLRTMENPYMGWRSINKPFYGHSCSDGVMVPLEKAWRTPIGDVMMDLKHWMSLTWFIVGLLMDSFLLHSCCPSVMLIESHKSN